MFKQAKSITMPIVQAQNIKCGINIIDKFVGDGFVRGSVSTLTAEAGTGKTQLMLMILSKLYDNGYKVGYCTNEESIEQLASTCMRINAGSVPIINESNVDKIVDLMKTLDFIVIDSFSMLKTSARLTNTEKYCIDNIIAAARQNKCTTFLIVHQTKAKKTKGTTYVTHGVDAVFNIEKLDNSKRRVLSLKNRYGPQTEFTATLTNKGYVFPLGTSSVATLIANGNGLSIIELLDMTQQNSADIQLELSALISRSIITKTGRGIKAIYQKI